MRELIWRQSDGLVAHFKIRTDSLKIIKWKTQMKKTKTKLKEESNKVPREDWFEQGARKKKSTNSEERSYKREQNKKREKKGKLIGIELRDWMKKIARREKKYFWSRRKTKLGRWQAKKEELNEVELEDGRRNRGENLCQTSKTKEDKHCWVLNFWNLVPAFSVLCFFKELKEFFCFLSLSGM